MRKEAELCVITPIKSLAIGGDMSEVNDWEEGYEMGRCDNCGKSPVRIITDNDPYTAEINPEDENPESNWCWECYHQRLDDI